MPSNVNNIYSKGNNDECYTPKYGVAPIIKYIPKNARVWLPFDTKKSNFYIMLKKHGIKCLASHIDEGKDFYTYEPKKWDVIVSNPPFTGKRLIVERALSFGKPFALILPLGWLNDSAPSQLFMNKGLQLLMFDKRIRFYNKGIKGGHPPFSSAYYCWNFLPSDLIMETLSTKLEQNNKLF